MYSNLFHCIVLYLFYFYFYSNIVLIPFYYISLHSMFLLYSVISKLVFEFRYLFYHVLYTYIVFYSILCHPNIIIFSSIIFHMILILFWSILFYSMRFYVFSILCFRYSVLLYPCLFNANPFCFVLLLCLFFVCFILFCFCSMRFLLYFIIIYLSCHFIVFY